MKILRKNDGFTLVELMVTILVATIVTLSATTVLLLGIRIMNKSTDTAERQYTTRVLLTALEGIAAEGTVSEVKNVTGPAPEDNTKEVTLSWQVLDGTKVIFSYDRATQSIYTGEAAADKEPLLDGIAESSATLEGNILTFMVQHNGQVPYETSIYCRLLPDDFGGDSTGIAVIERLINGDNIVSSDVSHYLGRNAALKTLASEYGSRGVIQNGNDAGKYYSEWYIGGYEGNSTWNENTPWCACFVSWALAQPSVAAQIGITNTPKYANVQDFKEYFETKLLWKDANAYTPVPGDMIFFDTDGDPEADHMGIVLAVTNEGKVYTIEGNSYNRVRTHSYYLAPDHVENAAKILGYGEFAWY